MPNERTRTRRATASGRAAEKVAAAAKPKLGRRAAAAQISSPPELPSSDVLSRSHQILEYAHESAESLLDGFNRLTKERGRGAPSDEELDLLRAMLLLSSAGLDACMKRLIKDALPTLLRTDGEPRQQLVRFATKRLRRGDDDAAVDAKFLAGLLLGSPEQNLIDAYIRELTGSSLQSRDELFKVASALGVSEDKTVTSAIAPLKETFDARNQITHEMDVDFESPGRNRRGRKREDMVNMTNGVLGAADAILRAVDGELQSI